jgi:hypothetical protein
MARPRISDAAKRLHGTYRPSQSPAVTGRVRIEQPIDPPDDLDKDAKAEWQLHQRLCLQAGTLAVTDLRAFRLLIETAVLVQRSYKAALKAGPVSHGDRGSKTSPEWSAWIAAHQRYVSLLDRFGLLPMAAKHVPMLPPAKGTRLEAV